MVSRGVILYRRSGTRHEIRRQADVLTLEVLEEEVYFLQSSIQRASTEATQYLFMFWVSLLEVHFFTRGSVV